MVIDSKQYNGLCSCGRTHEMATEFCLIESGCLKTADVYMKEYGLQGYTVAVYDENTYRATAGRHPRADAEVVLPAKDLHANERGVALLLEKLPEQAKIIVAVGAGTVHDISRYCAYMRGIDFVSCPTAASVDGFCSSVAAMTWEGCKKTLTAVAPKIVVADLDIIKHAPIRLARSGFGDMIGKYVSLTDWKLGSLLTGEFYCDTIADMTRQATGKVLDSAEGILSGDGEAYENLMSGLLMSGLAMQMMGNSRPASGAEHHISHFIEMNPPAAENSSHALHGEKVGVGTLLAVREYRRLTSVPRPACKDYRPVSPEVIAEIFGAELTGGILEENAKDAAGTVTAELLRTNWDAICRVVAQLPRPEQLEALYKKLNVKASLDEIGVPSCLEDVLLTCSPLVRNRLTLMRLRRCIDL